MAAKSNDTEKKVSIILPKIAGEDPTVFVGINGKNYLIPRGKRVEVPEAVAEIIYASERAAEAADEYSDEQVELGKTIIGA